MRTLLTPDELAESEQLEAELAEREVNIIAHNYLEPERARAYVLIMASTSSEWLAAFSDHTGISPVTVVNYARALRAENLNPTPSRGGGHRKTLMTATHFSNFILAQAGLQASDAAEAVQHLRSAKFAHSSLDEQPYFGAEKFGIVFDKMIEGRATPTVDDSKSKYLPDEIHLSVQPVYAEMIWYKSQKFPERKETYVKNISSDSSPKSWMSRFLVKRTYVNPELIELAASMLRDPLLNNERDQ